MEKISKTIKVSNEKKAIIYSLGIVAGISISMQSFQFLGSWSAVGMMNVGIAVFSASTWMLLKAIDPKNIKSE